MSNADDRQIKTSSGRKAYRLLAGAAALAVLSMVSACGTASTEHVHGFVVTDDLLQQVPEGASQDHVNLVLGTPSVTAEFGNEVYYYISQTKRQEMRFLKAELVDQKVLAVYFDEEGSVDRLANYGLQDGKVFDFITKTTPTGGKDVSFVQQLIEGAGRGLVGGI
ncbi:outer membrane protein assembly factor BamE [Coralliovum pocilloporae]|uniref:outer membrane protein assembly factor BamE n=1 Tax=Coralliovum pocilloporae TaxID=3066369 RepID=UPI003306A811